MQAHYSSQEYEKKYTYHGNDLGLTLDSDTAYFRLWAPDADSVALRVYESGDCDRNDLMEQIPMEPSTCGTWTVTLPRTMEGRYYDYLVTRGDHPSGCCDPYAKAVGVNGHRSMILDMSSTDPEGWQEDRCIHAGAPMTDQIIYEVHVRDLTVDPSSGIRNKGKYIGLCERGTTLPSGKPTGLDHILGLGVTHVQLQPIYDFGSVDESGDLDAQYNWGYDPVNYNAPEGSFATDPFCGKVRIRELKELIRTLHSNGLGVYMDVVYNHVYDRDSFCFNMAVPGYFSRPGSNGSGCGNDTASERSMVRKFIVDSLYHWVREYHIDGFRFDLAGLIDADTIREAMETIHSTHPNIRFYGEGWCMESLTTKPNIPMTDQAHSDLLPGFAFFNDSFRDLLRGSVFFHKEKGFLTGKTGIKNPLRTVFMGITPWACSPSQSINYLSCHDNHTLFDRLSIALPKASKEDIARRCRVGAAFTMLSQGIPFLLAGEELLRSKPLECGGFDENSYRSPDSINAIRWSDLNDPLYANTLDYYKGLIRFRKAHSILRLQDRSSILRSIRPLTSQDAHTLIFRLSNENEKMLVIFNLGDRSTSVDLPDGAWELFIDENTAGLDPIRTERGRIEVPHCSAKVLIQRS